MQRNNSALGPATLTFFGALALVGPLACSGGGPDLNAVNGDVATGGAHASSVGGAPSGQDPGGTTSGGANQNGSGGSSSPGTMLVCTPVCEDTPRSSESCADAKNWGFCEQEWFGDYCQETCGTCDGTEEVCVEVPIEGSGGSSGGGGTTPVTPVPGGSPEGWASRYWDCCKQHCSWSENAGGNPANICSISNAVLSDAATGSACSGGGAYTCWSMAPWAVSDNLAYGFAAVPPGGACGKCYQLDFNGKGHHNDNDAGSKTLAGKTMIVQATNIGHDVNGGQFDILIPGGGVGAFNACSTQWGTSDLGAQYGGFLTSCDEDVGCLRNKCNTVFAGKEELLQGCLFHADWMAGANNPEFHYAEVSCPAALTQASGM